MEGAEEFHGGRLIAKRLRAHGVSKLFTLSGGHLFSIYDGCRAEGIEIVDVRHEQTAAFAAEGWAKVTRELGVCALTAGPGRDQRDERARLGAAEQLADAGARRARAGVALGAGLAAGDRSRPVRAAAREDGRDRRLGRVRSRSWSTRRSPWRSTPHSGPVFLDFPLDHVFSLAADSEASALRARSCGVRARRTSTRGEIERAAWLLREAERPVIMAGTGLYWGRGEAALRELAEALQIPVFVNGLGRGCFPADHELATSHARAARRLKGADVALVIGVPLDFRLGFGGVFGEETAVVFDRRGRAAAGAAAGAGRRALRRAARGARWPARRGAVAAMSSSPSDRAEWLQSLRAVETEQRRCRARGPRRTSARRCIRRASTPSLRRCSTATRSSSATAVTSSPSPGGWSIRSSPAAGSTRGRSAASAPGPATRSRPSSRTPSGRSCCCRATAPSASPGWSGTRSCATACAVIGVMGNNGIWALEKHPMESIYGYSVAAELQPELRYDQVVADARRARRAGARARTSCGPRSSARSRRASRR